MNKYSLEIIIEKLPYKLLKKGRGGGKKEK